MGILRDAALVAAGYGLNKLVNKDSHSADNDNLYKIIDDYARRHGIYYTDEGFYNLLIEIAQRYKP